MPQGTPTKQKKRSKSVLKNIRQTERRTIVNRANRTRVRTAIRKFRTALASGGADAAQKLLGLTLHELDRAARKGSLSRNAARRYKSRLSLGLKALRAKK